MNGMLRRAARNAALVIALTACSTAQTHLGESAPKGRAEWASCLVRASQEAAEGHHAVADKLLADYTIQFPASPEAAEAMYWRAIFKMDPANESAAPHDAAILLDGYLSSGTTVHRTEAQTLRRVANALDARTANVASPSQNVVAQSQAKSEAVKSEEKARDEEILRLKDELAKANAELERIKKRLAPKP
jgi:hypothetical protein